MDLKTYALIEAKGALSRVFNSTVVNVLATQAVMAPEVLIFT